MKVLEARSTVTTAGALTPNPIWIADEREGTQSVAWGDYDGDGDLDLAVGNGILPGNPTGCTGTTAGSWQPSAIWSSTESDDTTSVAWGDYDGDGDLDLAVGN